MEGKTDQRVIPYLMEANGVPWPDYRDPDCPAFIAEYGSVNDAAGIVTGCSAPTLPGPRPRPRRAGLTTPAPSGARRGGTSGGCRA